MRMRPPTPLFPSPTIKLTLPPTPLIEVPVRSEMDALLPLLEVPVTTESAPLTPAVPASAVRMLNAPLDVADESPDESEVLPPVTPGAPPTT